MFTATEFVIIRIGF